MRDRNPRVSALTKLFWSGALLARSFSGVATVFARQNRVNSPQTLVRRQSCHSLRYSSGFWASANSRKFRALGSASGGHLRHLALDRCVSRFADFRGAGLAVRVQWRFCMALQTAIRDDRLANTLVVASARSNQQSVNPLKSPDWTEEDAQIAALVVTEQTGIT